MSGCFHSVLVNAPVNRGLLVADGLAGEPAFDVEYEPGTGRSVFSWTSVTGSTTSVVSIAALDGDGVPLWK